MNNFYLILALVLQYSSVAHAFVAGKPACLITNTSPSNNQLQPLYAKRKFTINTELTDVTSSSDGLLADRKKEQEKRAVATATVKSNLGKKGNPAKNKSQTTNNGKAVPEWKAKKADNLSKQRNGDVDSRFESGSVLPADMEVQIKVAKRGGKNITLVRGLTNAMEDRKKLLKELKSKLGGGGAMIEGVLELQGAHGDKVCEVLKKKGYSNAKLVK